MVNTVSCASLAVIQSSQHFGFELKKLEETLGTQSNHSVCRARLWGEYLQNNLSTKLTCLEECLKSCTKLSQCFSRGASQEITRLDFKQLCDAFEADRTSVGLLCWPWTASCEDLHLNADWQWLCNEWTDAHMRFQIYSWTVSTLERVESTILSSLYALPFYDFDLRASHARTLLPAALASVPFGFVLVRVRVQKGGAWQMWNFHLTYWDVHWLASPRMALPIDHENNVLAEDTSMIWCSHTFSPPIYILYIHVYTYILVYTVGHFSIYTVWAIPSNRQTFLGLYHWACIKKVTTYLLFNGQKSLEMWRWVQGREAPKSERAPIGANNHYRCLPVNLQ